MLRIFRVIQKGCIIRDAKVSPGNFSFGAGDGSQGNQHKRTAYTAVNPGSNDFFRDLAEDLETDFCGRFSSRWCFGSNQNSRYVTDEDDHDGKYFSTGFSSTEDGNQSEGNAESSQTKQNTESNWQNSWTWSFQHDMWSFHPSCHILEAVGWGTAIVSGLRISHSLQSSRENRREGTSRCWLTNLQKLVALVVKHHLLQLETGYFSLSSTFKSMLPSGAVGSAPLSTCFIRNVGERLPSISAAATLPDIGRSAEVNLPHVSNCTVVNKSKDFPATLKLDTDVHNGLKSFPHVIFGCKDEPAAVALAKDESHDFPATLEDWGQTVTAIVGLVNNAQGVKLARQGDIRGARRLWEKATVEANCEHAHFNLGLLYELGLGVRKDLDKALEHYSRAAGKDHQAALFNSAMIHLRQPLDVSKNQAIAIQLLEKAVELGHKESQRELGVLYMELPSRDVKRAASLFEKAAQQKDMKATYFLGICYENGWGVESNISKAVSLYEIAATGCHPDALFNLAVFYETGKGGVSSDQKKALELFHKAAVNGCVTAKNHLKCREATTAPAAPKKTVSSAKDAAWPQRTMEQGFHRLFSGYDSDMLADESDSDSTYFDSSSDLSESDISKSLSPPRSRISYFSRGKTAAANRNKPVDSQTSFEFSSDEEQNDFSLLEDSVKLQAVKHTAVQLR